MLAKLLLLGLNLALSGGLFMCCCGSMLCVVIFGYLFGVLLFRFKFMFVVCLWFF